MERGEAIARKNEYSLIEQFLIFLPALYIKTLKGPHGSKGSEITVE